ncbi:MAG: hypothetical protein KGN36_08565 [Acidobacteriota bacterium]|nr:hypothetical protein [Acidobacteriota bacterium]
MGASTIDPRTAIGRSPESLRVEERLALAGRWIALEIYTPRTLPLRRIEAIGASFGECLRMLKDRGLEPGQFEFSVLAPPY